MFYHIPPASFGAKGGSLVEEIQVPVLDAGNARYVQSGTLVAVVLGFAWVCWQLFRVAGLGGGRSGKEKRQ